MATDSLAIIYGLIVVKDTKKVLETQRSIAAEKDGKVLEEDGKKGTSFKELFSLAHIKAAFVTAFKKRKGGLRRVVILLILMFGVHGIAISVSSQVIKQYSSSNNVSGINSEAKMLFRKTATCGESLFGTLQKNSMTGTPPTGMEEKLCL